MRLGRRWAARRLMYSPGSGMRRHGRAFPFLLIVLVVATLLSSASASAATQGTAETRAGASNVVAEPLVGPPEYITAGQRLGNNPIRVVHAVATGVAANGGRALTKYDADFALGQITSGGRASALQLDEFGAAQGWIRSQTATGPVKYTDADGIARLTIKRGSPRAPGSGGPHVELRNADGFRVDPYGNLVTRRSVGNHTPIEWDW